MRNRYLFIITLLLLFTTSFASIPEGITIFKDKNCYTINFTLPQFNYNLVNALGKNYFNIEVANYGVTSEVGYPNLPQVTFFIALPNNQQQPAISNVRTTEQVQNLTKKIYPVQMPWPRNRKLEDRPFSINDAYYNSTGKSDQPFVSLSNEFNIAGVRGIAVTINPFKYNPIEDKLTIINNGSFRINISTQFDNNNLFSKDYNDYLKSIFENFEPGSPKTLINYLIITAPEYESLLTPLVNHKTANGYNVTVFNTSATGNTTTAIKNFIQLKYNDPQTKPEFILLVGDVDKIPCWTGTGEGNPKTDLNYACLQGTDFFADVSIGRFSISNTIELQNAINKTLYMENYIGTLQKKNVYMASTDNWQITEATHNFVIDSFFGPASYTNLKLYTHTYNATTSQLIAALNNNQIFAIYSGHGSQTSWADGPVLNQTQVRALTNTVYPFVYSFACVTGSFHLSTECFGETWLRTSNGGSTFYGSSVNSYWDEDDILEKRMIRAMFTDGLSKVTPMMDKGKFYLVQFYGSVTPTMLRYLEMYNLMGDPSISTKKLILPDSTAPTAITNLSTVNPTSNSITLNWTAPYDSTFGGVTAYDIRYSTTTITEANYNSATRKYFSGCADTLGCPRAFTIDSLTPGTKYYFAIKAEDIWGNRSPISNVPYLFTLGAPLCLVNPTSISKTIPGNSVIIDSIRITNGTTFPSTLLYNVQFANNTFPTGKVSCQVVSTNTNVPVYMNKGEDENHFAYSVLGQGGPDAFGYKWKDSDEPNGPLYVWNDITSSGTQITAWTATQTGSATDEGYVGPIPIGFIFKFYGQQKNQLYITTNGIICFDPVTASWYFNSQMPNTALPNRIIAPFWDDLDAKTPGTVHYKQDGNKFIIQWTNYQRFSGTGNYTFQLVIYQSGKIMVYYNTMTGTINSATIGIENETGSIGLQVAYNSNYVASSKALQFSADPEWLLTNNLNGLIYNGNSQAVQLTFRTEDFPQGNYSMDVIIKSNDPSHPSITVPVSMTVTAVPVEMTMLTAEVLNEDVLISWQTATESNNKGFKIERRKSDKNDPWNEIGFINGRGTTTEKTNYSFTDKKISSGKYKYRLKQIDLDGTFTYSKVIELEVNNPSEFSLMQNYPNPFNPKTMIGYSLPVKAKVEIRIYSSLGEYLFTIIDETKEAGFFTYEFDASRLTSGTYIYQMIANDGNRVYSDTKKMIFMK
jgi:hypothetical protein